MVKRKKRLEKGIESIEKQIKLHWDKRAVAIEEGKKELADYFEKEIGALEERKLDRKKKLNGR